MKLPKIPDDVIVNVFCLELLSAAVFLLLCLGALPETNFILSRFEGGYLWQGLTVLALALIPISIGIKLIHDSKVHDDVTVDRRDPSQERIDLRGLYLAPMSPTEAFYTSYASSLTPTPSEDLVEEFDWS